jgi:hypothetical protein
VDKNKKKTGTFFLVFFPSFSSYLPVFLFLQEEEEGREEKRKEEYDKTVNGDIDFNSPVNAYRSHCLF